jgi:simple sugar transport system ATP-binding protein
MQEILIAKGLYKSYGGVQALKNFNFAVGEGEIHCLVGENGSGKSTFVKIVVGAISPDQGEIILNGHHYTHLSPIQAIHEGVQVIYQDLSLFAHMSVAENIAINRLIAQGKRLVNQREIERIATEQLSKIGVSLDLWMPIEELSTANRQIVAICRALSLDAKILFMDEPTTALTRVEVDRLLSIVMELKQKGLSVVFISHKLNEVFEVADIITILRDGRKVGDFKPQDLDYKALTYYMTGREVEYPRYKCSRSESKPLLEVKNLSRKGNFENISFQLYPGDIVGLIGLLGSGRTELALTLFGLNPPDSGEIILEGKPITINSPVEARRLGIGLLPEDRQTKGLFLKKSVEENVSVTLLEKIASRLSVIKKTIQRSISHEAVNNMRIAVPNVETMVQSLSGGNQQKTIFARWAMTNPKIFILDSPTVGVDVGSKAEIYELIQKLASEGMGIILITDEMPELLANCNKALVLRNGRVIAELSDADLNQADITERVQMLISSNGNPSPIAQRELA